MGDRTRITLKIAVTIDTSHWHPISPWYRSAMNRSLTGWFRHLSIGQKLLISFGLILSLLALSLTALLFYLAKINSYVDRHKRITVPAIVTAAAMREAYDIKLALHSSTERISSEPSELRSASNAYVGAQPAAQSLQRDACGPNPSGPLRHADGP